MFSFRSLLVEAVTPQMMDGFGAMYEAAKHHSEARDLRHRQDAAFRYLLETMAQGGTNERNSTNGDTKHRVKGTNILSKEYRPVELSNEGAFSLRLESERITRNMNAANANPHQLFPLALQEVASHADTISAENVGVSVRAGALQAASFEQYIERTYRRVAAEASQNKRLLYFGSNERAPARATWRALINKHLALQLMDSAGLGVSYTPVATQIEEKNNGITNIQDGGVRVDNLLPNATNPLPNATNALPNATNPLPNATNATIVPVVANEQHTSELIERIRKHRNMTARAIALNSANNNNDALLDSIIRPNENVLSAENVNSEDAIAKTFVRGGVPPRVDTSGIVDTEMRKNASERGDGVVESYHNRN